jgi:hypothetical protein
MGCVTVTTVRMGAQGSGRFAHGHAPAGPTERPSFAWLGAAAVAAAVAMATLATNRSCGSIVHAGANAATGCGPPAPPRS